MGTATDPLVGQVLDARYRIEARLARGGMGTVYLAVDTRLDRPVAVKMMHPALATDERFVARFLREARATARLTSPHAVAMYDQGTDSAGAAFLVMEYVEGRTLRDLLDQRGRLSTAEALEVLEPVLAALAAAHAAGIVHRDVKPENVLLADDGRVKVADFGLARAVSPASAATQGLLLGTVAYLAPEQVERGPGDEAGAASDVYAAGILLYEMLTGTPPYDGDSPLRVVYRHVHDDVPAPSSVVAGVPAPVDALVERATRREPGQRPRDAGVLHGEVVALRRALSAVPGAAPPTAPSLLAGPAGPAQRRAPERPTTRIPLGTAGQEPAPPPARPSATPLDYRSAPDAPRGTRRRRRLRRGPLLAMLVVLALGLGTGSWWVAAGPGRYTTTPALLQLSLDQAQDRADAAGVRLGYAAARFDEQVPADRVLATSPGPGAPIAKDGVVEVVLSKGRERVELPDLRGRGVDEARRALVERSFVVSAVEERFDGLVPAGAVLASDPASGALLRPGQLVTLVVSRGVPPVEVRDYLGTPAGPAADELRAAGLRVTGRHEHDDTVPAGSVLRQAPAGGTAVPPGAAVELVTSLGPAPVPVPGVSDTGPDDAVRRLEAAGFRVDLRGPRLFDRVTGTSPAAGTLAPRGSLVVVSTW